MEQRIKITTSGAAGSATGSGMIDMPQRGYQIDAIRVDYTGVPATTDVTITEDGGLGQTVLTLTNNNTTKVARPRVLLQDTSGANLTAVYAPIYIPGRRLLVSVAQADAAADAVMVTVYANLLSAD